MSDGKTFDAVAWMRKRRAEIDAEDAGLSWYERSLKTEKLLADDPLWLRFKHRMSPVRGRVEAPPVVADRKPQTPV